MNILLRKSGMWIQGYVYGFTSASHALHCDFVNVEQVRVFGPATVVYKTFFSMYRLEKNNCKDNSYNAFLFFAFDIPPSSAVPKK